MRKIILAAVMVASCAVTALADGHWGEIPMKYMAEAGYLQAAEPDTYVTRLDASRVLAKLPLIDKGSNYIFTDTSDNAVVRVAKAGLMSGGDNQAFRPDDGMSREETAKILSLLTTNPQGGGELSFADTDEVSVWARPYIAALVRDNIILGYEDSTFRPQESITRAEFATLFMKIRDAYSVNEIMVNAANNARVQPLQYLSVPDGAVGVLSIPSLGINNLPVVEDGENLNNIKTLPGHFVNTAIFDGNVGICGHDFRDKSPWFGRLGDLREGDAVVWQTKFGVRRYAVAENKHIAAEDWSGLMEFGDDRITLITCLEGYSQTTRISVTAASVD
ncbi:MAG: sortase [Clostridiales bacterium]|jgi:LPXTG-site transpeptidase (sortase) family protein|nr:sortase [Clostridiales bacterium]